MEERITELENSIKDLQEQLAEAKKEQVSLQKVQAHYDMGKQFGSELDAIMCGMIDAGLSNSFVERLVLQQVAAMQFSYGGLVE